VRGLKLSDSSCDAEGVLSGFPNTKEFNGTLIRRGGVERAGEEGAGLPHVGIWFVTPSPHSCGSMDKAAAISRDHFIQSISSV
jgi:hypothetical protein